METKAKFWMYAGILFILFMAFLSAVNAQPVTTPTPDESITNSLKDAVVEYWGYINLVYLITFMLCTYLVNDVTDASNTPTFKWIEKTPKALRALIMAVILIAVFIWAFKITGRKEIFGMFISTISAMVVYKFGIGRILRIVSKRAGLKFDDEETKPATV